MLSQIRANSEDYESPVHSPHKNPLPALNFTPKSKTLSIPTLDNSSTSSINSQKLSAREIALEQAPVRIIYNAVESSEGTQVMLSFHS